MDAVLLRSHAQHKVSRWIIQIEAVSVHNDACTEWLKVEKGRTAQEWTIKTVGNYLNSRHRTNYYPKSVEPECVPGSIKYEFICSLRLVGRVREWECDVGEG